MDRTQNENTIQYMKHTKYRLKPTVCVMSLFENMLYLLRIYYLFCPLILMNFLKFMLHMIFQLQRIRLHRLLCSERNKSHRDFRCPKEPNHTPRPRVLRLWGSAMVRGWAGRAITCNRPQRSSTKKHEYRIKIQTIQTKILQ